MLRILTLLIAAVSLGFAVEVVLAQPSIQPLTDANSFPFVLPWDDGKTGTATDVSFLNTKPAGKNGPIVVKDGHFVEEQTGKRVRFFGVNITAKGAFPGKADAEKIAARLAKLGINIVRFHHINNGWDTNGGTLWKRDRLFIEIDSAQLDRLDYFLAALKKQGIYANINLQTAREYVPELGFPESVRQIPNYQKQVDKVNAKMIQLQKDFARQLLDRKNSYTGLKYADDPALMVLEINNENSLVGAPWEKLGTGPFSWPEPFKGEIVKLWNAWLKKTYATDAKLAEAWQRKNTLIGKSLLTEKSGWTTENQSNGDVKFETLPARAGADYAGRMQATINSNPGPNWHVQAHLGGLNLENGNVYTLQFTASADKETTIGVDARLNKPDWRNVGLETSVKLGPIPKKFEFVFEVDGAEPNASRISFVLGDARGTVMIISPRLFPGARADNILTGKSLAQGNFELPSPDVSPRWRDYLRFLADTERAYSEGMRAFLRDELGFKKANIIDTQITWGGLSALDRERSMEFADNHEYWNHPVFPGRAWDANNYRVDRRALVNELGKGEGTLGSLAKNRILGKPYSVSEYNHPAPSDYQCEMMPLYATVAAFQDWDIIYVFDWGATGTGIQNDKYDGYFDSSRNPAKSAFFPATALIFRSEAFPVAKGLSFVSADMFPSLLPLTVSGIWNKLGQRESALSKRLGFRPEGNESKEVHNNYAERLRPFILQGPPEGNILAINAPQTKGVVGFVGGKTCRMYQASFTFEEFGSNFAALTLTATDGKPLMESKRALLTLAGRVENKNMGWNTERTSVGDRWGEGPVRAEFVPCKVEFYTDGPREVYALNPDGTRKQKIAADYAIHDSNLQFDTDTDGKLRAKYEAGVLSFAIRPDAKSLWFEIVKK